MQDVCENNGREQVDYSQQIHMLPADCSQLNPNLQPIQQIDQFDNSDGNC